MKKRVVITGVGMIGDFGLGKEDFLNFIEGRKLKQKITEFNLDSYIDTGLLRRADQVSYFASIAAKFALEDANLLNGAEVESKHKFGVIMGTVHGALEHTIDYHKALVLDDPATVSPSLFSNSVINAAVSCISNIFKINGYTLTVPGYAGVHQAVKLATEFINNGNLDMCLVGGVDINNGFLAGAYSSCMEDNKSILNSFGGSGFLVLESLDVALRRGSRIYAEIIDIGITSVDYNKMLKHKIIPIKSVSLQNVDCVFTYAFSDKDSKMREDLLLSKINQDKTSIFNCSDLFGCTFAAAESFQVILGVIKLSGLYNRVLTSYLSLTDVNASLLLGRFSN